VTETSIPTNETTPEAVTAASEETTASTIPASELPEHPFARIGEDGTVYVKDGDEERVIGGFPEGIPASPYALYERRYADLEATIKLFEDRMAQLSPRDIDQTLATLREQVASPNVVGDIPALRARVEAAAKAAGSSFVVDVAYELPAAASSYPDWKAPEGQKATGEGRTGTSSVTVKPGEPGALLGPVGGAHQVRAPGRRGACRAPRPGRR